MRATRVVCMTAVAIAVGGCTTYRAAPLDPRQSVEEFAARRLDDQRQWDRGELLAVALIRNPELAVTRARVQAALAHEVAVGRVSNPSMDLQSEYGAHGEPHPWLYGVAFDWLLRSPGRRHLEQQIARLDTANTRLGLMDQVWTLR